MSDHPEETLAPSTIRKMKKATDFFLAALTDRSLSHSVTDDEFAKRKHEVESKVKADDTEVLNLMSVPYFVSRLHIFGVKCRGRIDHHQFCAHLRRDGPREYFTIDGSGEVIPYQDPSKDIGDANTSDDGVPDAEQPMMTHLTRMRQMPTTPTTLHLMAAHPPRTSGGASGASTSSSSIVEGGAPNCNSVDDGDDGDTNNARAAKDDPLDSDGLRVASRPIRTQWKHGRIATRLPLLASWMSENARLIDPGAKYDRNSAASQETGRGTALSATQAHRSAAD